MRRNASSTSSKPPDIALKYDPFEFVELTLNYAELSEPHFSGAVLFFGMILAMSLEIRNLRIFVK